MDKKSFLAVIRKAIREEVQSVLRNEFRSMLIEIQNSSQSPNQQTVSKNKVNSKFSKNPMINSLLQETALSSNNIADFEDYPTMNYNFNNVTPVTQAVVPEVVLGINNEPVSTKNEAVKMVVDDILNKDYSSFLKLVDKKSSQRKGNF